MRNKIIVAIVVLITAVTASVGVFRSARAAGTVDYVSGTFFTSTGWAVHFHNATGSDQVVKFKIRDENGTPLGNSTQIIAPHADLPMSENCTDCGRVIQITVSTIKVAPTLTYTTSTGKIAVHPGSWLVTTS